MFCFSTVGPCLAGQRKLSGFTYTTLVMFCLFSALAQAQCGLKFRSRRCRGCPDTGGSTQWACASRRVGGEWLGQQPAEAGGVGFIFPVGIAWSLSLVHSCLSRVLQLPLAVCQPFLVYLGGLLSMA